MPNQEIKVPNIGEFKDVEVIEVLISNGQSIKKNDPLITIESDKSSVEIPSSDQGKIKSINIKVGDKVSEGDIILILENSPEVKEEIREESKSFIALKKKESSKEEIIQSKIAQRNEGSIVSASPKVRKFARELGADINQISGSENGGRVVEEDIKNFVSLNINKKYKDKEDLSKKIKIEFEHSDFGKIEVKDIPRVKKLSLIHI
mgnify:FL=1